ncbi:hypothetical protein [Natronospira bacteriovora]|uniref:Uncharacterized protein n=1 Tax=Natronospira bacteriovora TaxID=3069753 RepID=A0ABU0W6P4_9GAMM|nr:hypothetical protein [Natronospira sp. AB-CW4]MDQ2069676.1 hypothetical protein [Natronospira sp. AB-CW4]
MNIRDLKTLATAGAVTLFLAAGTALASDARQDRPSGDAVAAFATDNGKITITGSRISRDVNRLSVRGRVGAGSSGLRVYTREDIYRTGAMDLDDALWRLDPRLSTTRVQMQPSEP